jgi:pantetheine-phosphate adenylyltransferase
MAKQRFSTAFLRLKWISADLLASVYLMKRAVCPGSFDPVTLGHLDIIERASAQFEEVVVAVLVNRTKSSMFTVQERMEMITKTTAHLPNIRVDSWSGLLVEYCKSNDIQSIVKGLRAVTDFDYELQMAQVNLQASGVETMFMATAPAHSFLSSSLVKELAHYGGDVSSMVPKIVNEALKARVAESGN